MDLDGILPRGVVDATIRVEPVSPELSGGRRLTDWLTATPDEVLIAQSGIRVLIRGTDDVVVDVDDDADLGLLRPVLYGAVVQILLLHAGTFCLHATAVRHSGSVVALAGHSGAGKSTTAASLCRFSGAELLVDDLAPTCVVEGRPRVQAYRRPVHLTLEAIDRLGLGDVSDTTVLIPGPKGKVALPATQFGGGFDEPTWFDLDRLVTLSVDDDRHDGRVPSPDVAVREVSGAERLRWVVRLSNGTGLAALGERATPYFEWATGLADALRVVHVVRPGGVDTLPAVCDAVLGSGRQTADSLARNAR